MPDTGRPILTYYSTLNVSTVVLTTKALINGALLVAQATLRISYPAAAVFVNPVSLITRIEMIFIDKHLYHKINLWVIGLVIRFYKGAALCRSTG